MINNQEENTLKVVVVNLVKEFEELKNEMKKKMNDIHSSQGKVNASLQELTTARKTGAPVQYMKADVVQQAIKDNLNSQLVGSTINVKVNDPVASLGKQSQDKIDNLISTTEKLEESIKSIKPQKPLLNIIIHDGKKYLWFGVVLAVIFLIGMFSAIIWANKTVNANQDQAFYWAYRAYQAALSQDAELPGEVFHKVMSSFTKYPEMIKDCVISSEEGAEFYQMVKQDLFSIIRKKDSRDIRVLDWGMDNDELWYKYRFFDEEIVRFIHVWPDKKAEETTDKNVTDLASARKYSKRNIWTTLQDPSKTTAE